MTNSRPLSLKKERAPAMTVTADAGWPTYGRAIREDIDRLHADYLVLARRAARLAAELDHGDYCAASGRVRAAVGAAWRGAEELHVAFHKAPPRSSGPHSSIARLCGRRMRYLTNRASQRADR